VCGLDGARIELNDRAPFRFPGRAFARRRNGGEDGNLKGWNKKASLSLSSIGEEGAKRLGSFGGALAHFASLHSARQMLNYELRVSPIRVCGLGGARIALNDRAPFRLTCLPGKACAMSRVARNPLSSDPHRDSQENSFSRDLGCAGGAWLAPPDRGGIRPKAQRLSSKNANFANRLCCNRLEYTNPPHGCLMPHSGRFCWQNKNQKSGKEPDFWKRKPSAYFKWPETSLVISNMLTLFLPLNTAPKASSALI